MTTAARQFGDYPWARDSAKRPAVLSMRITSPDYILVPPGPHDKLKHAVLPTNAEETATPLRLERVPIIRIFGAVKGSTHSACVHVHDCFPYLRVPYDGVPDHGERTHTLKRPTHDRQIADAATILLHPVATTRCPLPTCFLIYWHADLSNIPRLAGLLTGGAILVRAMKAHESHLPYLFQFKADHGLHNMGWLDLAQAAPRAHADRTAHCHVEVDMNAASILNFHRINAVTGDKRSQVSLSAPASGVSEQQRLIQSLDALWIDEDELRFRLGLPLYAMEPLGTQAGTPPSWDSSDGHLAALRDWLAKRRTWMMRGTELLQWMLEEQGDDDQDENEIDSLGGHDFAEHDRQVDAGCDDNDFDDAIPDDALFWNYDLDSDLWPDDADMDFQFDDGMDWTTLGVGASSLPSSTSARIPQYDGANDMTVHGRGTPKPTSTRRTARDRIGKRAAPPPRKFRDRTLDAIAYHGRQVAAQRAAESTPLVMEPVSAFYPDPVVVLDFQSLYPSIMIAFNYCFSTCLGHVPISGVRSSKLGASQVDFPAHLQLEDLVRKSTLAQMLTEMLDTRVMVKNLMKLHEDNKVLHKVLDARQLGLNLIANATYLGDAVVQTGREVLEKAITMINRHPTWGARVVYGDTDSAFLYLPGATKSRAILATKKRYIGHKYESPNDVRPVFDAKGVETIRRDGCPVVAKTMRSSLEILFRTRDLTQVKMYLTRQWTKILESRVSIRDFVIAKKVRLGTYSDRVLPPPGAHLAMRKIQRDPRAEPQYAERVPYLVVTGAPGDRLIDQVKCPTSVLRHRELRLNGHYYIHKKIIRALNRLFNLMGVDPAAWYADMPKPAARAAPWTRSQDADGGAVRATIDRYYRSTRCGACGEVDAVGKSPLCRKCAERVQRRVVHLTRALVEAEDRYAQLARLCADCAQVPGSEVECDALACAVLFDRVKARNWWRNAVEGLVGVDGV
ncbi:hypothetical protein AMAG_13375 [Allomyces macrogynus ATCC 38327]|uniref:DNA-directed DNA polymerase n=1 Tax=Allomyces macrogynus (strain ATCC 38327) TaxID=578462 RepID=A0A0L0T1L7_ALLM3|nr:hypothetical protein AMAG_13375 [Allomyces macrogynus ATCC 38327]|eukprot:KNE68733.1 hypothetical protein AMAG_13375 [Allomyces macrogynus ATCC 38327]